MKLKGVCYDVGNVMGINWRPDFRPEQVKPELQVIRDDMHCNAVKISGFHINRVMVTAKLAAELGPEVWLNPTMWDKSPEDTLRYLTNAARAAEEVREQSKNQIVFVAGGELTLFMRGIIEGNSLKARLKNPNLFAKVRAGEHNGPLNEYLAKANRSIREVFHGKVTYASLVWEKVNWVDFDFVGVDHYRTRELGDRYTSMLQTEFDHAKPVVITEFGHATTHNGIGEDGLLLSTAGLEKTTINQVSQLLHYKIPLAGRLVRPHLNGEHVRDEAWQAEMLVETLKILDSAGVEGAFIMQFLSQITPYSDTAKYDLDMASSSLVKYYEGGRRGTTYPDMPWEPKESFRAVADYFAASSV